MRWRSSAPSTSPSRRTAARTKKKKRKKKRFVSEIDIENNGKGKGGIEFRWFYNVHQEGFVLDYCVAVMLLKLPLLAVFLVFFLQIDGRMDGRIETQCYKKVEIS